MCEFCSFGPQYHREDKDSRNPDLAGFFSSDEIELALRQLDDARAARKAARLARKQAALENNDELRNDLSSSSSLADGSDPDGEDDDEDFADADDDASGRTSVATASRKRIIIGKAALVKEYEHEPEYEMGGSQMSSSDLDAEPLHPRDDEPNIYNFPSSIRPEYSPVPPSIKIGIAAFSFISAVKFSIFQASNHLASSAKRAFVAVPSGSYSYSHPLWTWTAKRIMKVLIATFCTFFFSHMLVQDTFYPPDRIDTPTLLKNKWLPSPLSKFSTVKTAIPARLHQGQSSGEAELLDMDMEPIGVHFLEYYPPESSPKNTNLPYKFDAIHFSHGFGASSLSWVPALPSLVNRLNARVGIAHDAPGFGFTDRPRASGRKNGLVPFSAAGSASLGNALLMNTLKSQQRGGDYDDDGAPSFLQEPKSVALFGHSMGCATTLRMALSLPKDVKKTIVLVAPALVGNAPPVETVVKNGDQHAGIEHKPKSAIAMVDEDSVEKTKVSVAGIIDTQPSKIRSKIGLLIALLRRVILDPFIIFFLRRLVGRPNFWSNGLRLVWGNPDLVSDSDALRFQWPAIGLGWESGLLAFTRSRIASVCSYVGGELQLLQDVLKLPHTSVTIVHGERDRIVPLSMSQKIVDTFKDEDITFISMPGQGHDPFEEGCEEFVGLIESELRRR